MTTQPDRGHGLNVGAVVAGTYQVTRLLGRGGMGSVWEASHLRLPGKRVAIKVLHADIAEDHEALARFRREAEIATRLGHPNIVEVHDFNTLPDGKPYLVLELLVGESLEARLRRAPVAVDDAMRIAAQIGAALAAAHREQVIHRDLKPQNVFLVRPRDDGDGGELVKVLDFGISKIRGSQTVKTLESTLLGTPQYMAPEQATGNHAAVDSRTDVFALGAIVYEMLAGRPAFTGQSIPEVVFKVVYEQPTPIAELVPGLPVRVADAIQRALAKAQDERFPDVVTFVEEMAGVSLSTLRRSPISLAPAGTRATGMESTIAASGTGPLGTPSGHRAGGGGGEGELGDPDPLARTVDSGRRELAAIPRPAPTPSGYPPAMSEGRTESIRGPIAPAPRESIHTTQLDPPSRDSMPPPIPPAPTQEVRRGGRGRALLVAALLLLAAGGAAAAWMTRSPDGGDGADEARPTRERTRHRRPARTAAVDPAGGAASVGAATPAASTDGPASDPVATGATADGEASAAADDPTAGADRSAADPAEASAAAARESTGDPAIEPAGDGASRAPAVDPATASDAPAAPADPAAPAPPIRDAVASQLRPSPPRKPDRPRRAPREPASAGSGQADADEAPRDEQEATLADGERALRGGDFRQALVLAERALRHGAGPAAHALRARASCGIGDLGNAKASFSRIPRGSRLLRRLVINSCTRAGVDVGP